MLRIFYKTPHWPLGRDIINIGSAKSVPNTDKRHRLLPPLKIDTEPGKSLTNKLEGVIGELRCKLKDIPAKQADAIEGLRGEMKVLLGQQTEAIQALRDDIRNLLGKQTEVFTTLSAVKDSNTKTGSRSIIILWKVSCLYGRSHVVYCIVRLLYMRCVNVIPFIYTSLRHWAVKIFKNDLNHVYLWYVHHCLGLFHYILIRVIGWRFGRFLFPPSQWASVSTMLVIPVAQFRPHSWFAAPDGPFQTCHIHVALFPLPFYEQ